jgi:1-deoxy-D-xylulose-5-phosphate reductoisomerase
MKRIVILGATGSIGRNTLDVISHHADLFEVVGLAAGSNVSLLEAQLGSHAKAKFTVCTPEALTSLLASDPSLEQRSLGYGDAAITDLIAATKPDLVLNAFIGFVGLQPALFCLQNRIAVALANKEAIVCAGEILTQASAATATPIIPVDSEHAAISQCLQGYSIEQVKKAYLTASGGALRDRPLDELGNAKVEEVLSHPTWNMGDKITVDSATMLNKGLEVIEARWLFGLPLDKIEVVIHPQSIVHSLVEFTDGSILSQMGTPDMRLPILYALSYPDRVESGVVRNEIEDFPKLSFQSVNMKRYPCLRLALDAAGLGGNAPTVLIAANEMAVGSFLDGEISYAKIAAIIGDALDAVPYRKIRSIDDVFATAEETRIYVGEKFKLENKKYTWSL